MQFKLIDHNIQETHSLASVSFLNTPQRPLGVYSTIYFIIKDSPYQTVQLIGIICGVYISHVLVLLQFLKAILLDRFRLMNNNITKEKEDWHFMCLSFLLTCFLFLYRVDPIIKYYTTHSLCKYTHTS